MVHLKLRVPQLRHTGSVMGQPSGPQSDVSISSVELPAMRKDIVLMFVTSYGIKPTGYHQSQAPSVSFVQVTPSGS